MNERRIARIERQIKERIAIALQHEISDPRIGFVTICRVEVDKELQRCVVSWSMIGEESKRSLTAKGLEQASGFLRREVAQILHTRTVPTIVFRYDESVEGAASMRGLLDDLRREREDREGEDREGEADLPDGDPEPSGSE